MIRVLNILSVKNFFRALLFTSSFGLSLPAMCEYQYTISHMNQDTDVVKFKTKPRLIDLIQQAESLHQGIFWKATGIFDHANSKEIQSLKNKVIEALKSLALMNPSNKNAIESLQTFLRKINVASRLFLTIEPDKILTNTAANPQLTDKLFLNIPKRPNDILVISQFVNVQKIHFNTLTTTRGYLNEIFDFSTLGVDTVVVIQPNGQTFDSPVAYWNDKKERLLPGSVIFVPFRELPDSLSSLNKDIIRLLQHRVL